MSRAKKTKRQKQYSKNHLYRHFEQLSNHIKKLKGEATAPPKQQH